MSQPGSDTTWRTRGRLRGGGWIRQLKNLTLNYGLFSNLSKTYVKDKLSKCATTVLLVCCYLYRKRSNTTNINAEAKEQGNLSLHSRPIFSDASCLHIWFLIISVREGPERKRRRGQNHDVPGGHTWNQALFRCHPNFKFFHSLSITSIFSRLHGVLNVGKKITNYTV